MDVLPIALKLHGQRCLLIGGGQIARRKARLLLRAGAVLDVVSPEILPDLLQDALHSGGQHYPDAYPESTARLYDYRLVIAATDQAEINAQVFRDCEKLNVLVNSVDDPPHCRFIVPAIIDRSPLLVS
ncbi:MAG: bifunctional precorrin-2 dehydrogenase/sirohydrochlorin ferrochelatase, partial [Pseudomonadota bacterium]|nr:bifunctional precorrin-2 dehydrogenase/sirohydrochlorin ferrochelatase [Pseudomonadota bacterium]